MLVLAEATTLKKTADLQDIYARRQQFTAASSDDKETSCSFMVQNQPVALLNPSPCCLYIFSMLQGFSVDGKVGDGSDFEDYIKKCVYVEGGDSELDGFVMEGLFVQNCG